MVFQELDKWMLDIEEKKNPTPRERRQHMKLERVRNETYARYQKQPIKDGWCKAPMACRERAMPPIMRLGHEIGKSLNEIGKAFKGVSMKKRTTHQQNFRLIESELYFYKDTKKALQDMESEIIESSGHSETGIRSGISNPTGLKAERLLTSKEYLEVKRRIDAIEYAIEVFRNCHEPAKTRLIEMRYFERKYTDDGIISELNVSRKTFFRWKREFIELIAGKLGFVV